MIDEAIVGAAPWRWRTGQLNRWDGEMDDGSSSGEVDEGRRAITMDDVGEEARLGNGEVADGGGWVSRRGYGGLGFRMAKRRRWAGEP